MSKEDTFVTISKAVSMLKKSRNLFFITGAGISAESGLPTYRGVGGLYNDELTEEGIPIEVALAGQTLTRQPEITWKYLGRIEERCRGVTCNRAHKIIAEMEQHFARVWVLTQNIDGFHYEAGSHNVIDIHGDYRNLVCPACGWRATVKDYSTISIPPLCPTCGNIVRPDVVFFGEMLPQDKLQTLLRELEQGFDMYFSIGTTSVFPYISQPMHMAKSQGSFTVEINPGNTEISGLVDLKIRSGAIEAMERIWKEYLQKNKA